MDQGERVSQSGSAGQTGVLFGTLGAQSQYDAAGGIQCEVDRYLTGKETEPWRSFIFKAYKSQLPVIEQALETAGLMLGSDKSRGYCLEMICADFLAGVSLEAGNREALLPCLTRLVVVFRSRNGNNSLKKYRCRFDRNPSKAATLET